MDAWWGWSLTALLDGLYPHAASSAGPPGAQVGLPLLLTVGSSWSRGGGRQKHPQHSRFSNVTRR